MGASRHSLAQRAGEATIGGAAAQAAGAEVVEAVEQARAFVLGVAQRAHEWVAAGRVQGAWALHGREDSTRHLQGQRRTAARRPAVPELGAARYPRGFWSAGQGGVRRGRTGALSAPLPHPRGGPKRSGRWTQQSFLLGGQPPSASTSPTNPHSHPRNSPLGVLWVICKRHPFRAGPPHCSGEVPLSTRSRLSAASQRRPGLPTASAPLFRSRPRLRPLYARSRRRRGGNTAAAKDGAG